MKKYNKYYKFAPKGVIVECAIEFEENGKKFAVTMCDYFTHLAECGKFKKLGYVYVD